MKLGVLLWLQGLRSPALDVFFSSVTYLGDEIGVVVVMAILLWCVDRRRGLRMAAAFFLCGLLGQALKVVVAMPRPWMLYEGARAVEAALGGATGWSLPSGHTVSAVALYGSLFLMAKRGWAKALCVLAVLLVAVSRVYLGVHTLWDVLAALALGALGLGVSQRFADALERGGKAARAAIAVFFVLAGSALICALARLFVGGEAELVRDAVRASGVAAGFALGLALALGRRFTTRAQPTWQVVKLAVGLGIAVALQRGIPALAPGLPGAFLGYALLGVWAAFGYPAIVEGVMGGRGGRA